MSVSEDRVRFEALVRRHGAELYRYAYCLTRARQALRRWLQPAQSASRRNAL